MSEEFGLKPRKKKESSGRTVIVAAVIVAIGLAVGLGVGLGVGLNKVEYVTQTQKPTDAPTDPPMTTSSSTTEIPDGPWSYYRLPDTMVPKHYRLTLQPNLTTANFNGTIGMTIEVMKNTKYIIVHAHQSLKIEDDEVSLVQLPDERSVNIVRKFRQAVNQFYVMEASEDLLTGNQYLLTMSFSNSLTDAIVGIYISYYNDPLTNIRKGIVASDMEPTDSRRGYPCFDEPAMKVPYTTTIIHEYNHTALSNMPVKSTVDLNNGWNSTEFEKSVPMSTYLACFVVGELDYVEDFSGRNIPLRIYGAKYQIDGGQGDYALKVTKAMFDDYEELYNMNYSLPKYDQIALPEFLSGAMENWGLVTYRETLLMWDPNKSSTAAKQSVAAVIAHEMVHQWFGNIVTMKWWDNIWLNEGFASFFEYDGLHSAEPDWKTDAFNALFDVQSAKRADQTIGSHPIVVNVTTPSQIAEVFDTITYQKGASVLRYMQSVLGQDLFIGGLRNYLSKKQFDNADEYDLWGDIQEHIKSQGETYNVINIMNAWIQQLGYPVIHFIVNGTEVTAKQEIMLVDPDADEGKLPASEYDYKWNVTFIYFTSTDSTPKRLLLDSSMSEYPFTIPSGAKWIVANAGEKGLYRVNYDNMTWTALADQLLENHTVFTEVDRAQMMNDVLNLAPAEHMTYPQALNMTRYMHEEDSYFVWSALSSGVSRIGSMISTTTYGPAYTKYLLSKVKPIADNLGWNGATGTHEEKRLRRIILDMALGFGDKDALSNASMLFQEWRSGKEIHPDVRHLVYRYGVAGGDSSDWEFVLEKYKVETVAGEKSNLLRALASTVDIELITRLLNYSLDKTIIKEQDFFNCITYISYSEIGNRMAWAWVRLKWEELVQLFRIENMYLGRLVPNIVSNYNTPIQKWEVEDFFRRYPEGGAGQSRRVNALLRIDENIAFLEKNLDTIGNWLSDQIANMA